MCEFFKNFLTKRSPRLYKIVAIQLSGNMAESVYEGAIGIDLGMSYEVVSVI